MNVVFGSSKEYITYLRVLLMSLFESESDNQYDIYLLYHDDVTSQLADLSNWMEAYSAKLHGIYVPDAIYEMTVKAMKYDMTWHPACVYRYACIELLPDSIDRVLMLGIDNIIKGSIKELYEMEMSEDKWFAMCPPTEYILQCGAYSFMNMLKGLKKFGVDKIEQFYNTEVMLIDLKKCRDKFKYHDFTAFIEQNSFEWLDVTAICSMYKDHIQPIDGAKYNYYAPVYDTMPKDMDGIKIIQYINAYNKPWKYQDDSWYNQLWWSYARKAYNSADYLKLEQDMQRQTQEMAQNYRTLMKKLSYAPPKYELYYEFFSRFEEKRLYKPLDFPICNNKHIALYGYGSVGKLLWDTLKNLGYQMCCVISNENISADIPCVRPQNIEERIDLIIITPIYEEYAITKKLEQYSHAQIITALDLLDA